MTASAKTSPKHHKIRSLEVTGGFLQGIKMDFNDGLNCVIGGRGTGKTTVLEALRYSLDRMPNEAVDRKRYEALEKLLQANLGAGSIKVELETADGVLYSVARAFGETPLVTNADGKPVDIRIGHDMPGKTTDSAEVKCQNSKSCDARTKACSRQLCFLNLPREPSPRRGHPGP